MNSFVVNTRRLRLPLRMGTLFFAILAFSLTGRAQPWLTSLPEDSLGKISYAREVQLFDQYWSNRQPEKGKGYKAFMRKRWFWDRRLDETGELNSAKHWQGWEEKQRLFPVSATDEADWLPVGPAMIPTSGGGVGRVNCVTIHPSNPNIIWVGAASGGAWRSSDGGSTWETTTDYLPLLGVTSIVIDYVNPNVIYLATGDNDGGNTYSVGILKSTDGGDTWNQTGLTYQTTNYRILGKLMMSRVDNNLLVLTTHSA
ncbi:MAG: hypothetical protein OEM52_13270, partial [bacterium]|nr:hypothetical protein [bacterium]